MIFRRFLTISALVLWIGAGFAAPKAPPADEAVLKAYDAFKAGDPGKLQRASSQLGGSVGVHVLAPYLPATDGYQVLWPVLAIPILLAVPLVFSLIRAEELTGGS